MGNTVFRETLDQHLLAADLARAPLSEVFCSIHDGLQTAGPCVEMQEETRLSTAPEKPVNINSGYADAIARPAFATRLTGLSHTWVRCAASRGRTATQRPKSLAHTAKNF
jgi:hypothetical protein